MGAAVPSSEAARQKRLWLLIGTAFARLRGRPLLQLRVLLAGLAVVAAALLTGAARLLADLWLLLSGAQRPGYSG